MNDNFELFPIGRTRIKKGHSFICIVSNYREALKHLELFSHAIIFILQNSKIKLVTVKILYINEIKGIIEVDDINIEDNSLIIDIKPYFPCEDRVKEFNIPEALNEKNNWRIEKSSVKKVSSDIIYDLSVFEEEGYHSINQAGSIQKIDGENYIKLSKDLINNIRGFSHVKVLWWFDKFDKSTYRRITQCNPPYENAPRSGIFSTRSPVRPNPIALTTAKVLDIDNNLIRISDIEAFDKTPVIDIIPYIPNKDRVKDYYVPKWLSHWPQWLDDKENKVISSEFKVIESEVERINKYISKDTVKTAVYKFSLEDNFQDKEMNSNEIIIKGARHNNLKNISCKIPKNKMTVITGVSGSGKSSFAFDTIYAESQRRFMDSLSATGKGLFEQMEKPEVDEITGLPPAIAIEQKILGRNPRSTVGTMTEIYNYLRLLFSKIGIRHCSVCGRAIIPLKTDEIVNLLSKLQLGVFFTLEAYSSKEVFFEFIAMDNIEYHNELREAIIETLLKGNGAIIVKIEEEEEFVFQNREMCYHCNKISFQLTASTFSFNNPESMCPTCKGLGVELQVEVDKIISNPELSILDGASSYFGNLRKHRQNPNANWMKGEILALAEEMDIDLEIPWEELDEDFRKQALYGSDGRLVKLVYENNNGRKGEIIRPVEGAYNAIKRLFRENNGETANRIATSFMKESKCSKCNGERLLPEGRLVTIAETRFPKTTIMSIKELNEWIISLPGRISNEELKISSQILMELKNRLDNLIDVGVSYLSLDRSIPSLSGGEAQRLRLASLIGSGITNVLYVLDEPSIGLHPKDHEKLIKIIHKIRDNYNTVIVVEHKMEAMLAADKIIDIGPEAGVHGGLIIAEGTPKEIIQNPNSKTGRYIKKIMGSSLISERKKPKKWLKINGANHNNLKNIDVEIPLGVLTCITGVSGSGKSSLIQKTLSPALENILNKSEIKVENYSEIEGIEGLDKIISISQQPIGRSPKSNPATYTGVFEDIRNLFASLNESQKRGYKKNKFSFNSKEGQCEACSGEGKKCIQMHFMPDVWVECSVCHGKRFKKEVLDITYKEKSIADVLDMNVEEALEIFEDNIKIKKVLETLNEVGLGYIKLGQSSLSLSGGEAQRIKLAKELSKDDTGKTLYLLDEPTTGLHFADVENLVNILIKIRDSENTVLVIEHNLEVIKEADWVIDLGPEGGEFGGYIIAKGTPEEVSKVNESYTGQCLKKYRIKN